MKIRSRCDRCGQFGGEVLIDHDCPNLWEPQCCAGTMRRFEILEHVGLHADRLKEPTFVRERAFAAAWEEENKFQSIRATLLSSLLGRPATQDEATIAATLIQWLGSNIGQAFLAEATRRAAKDLEVKP